MEELQYHRKIQLNGKEHSVGVYAEPEVDLTECLEALNNDDLFNYLYNYHIKMFNEINNDSYYDGKQINSGHDLKESIESLEKIIIRDGVIWVSGEYWCDEEHGFSIAFPNGKFVKSQYDCFEYDRDCGEKVDFIPAVTILGQRID